MDATVAYHRAQHDINSEVDAMLGMYEIGAVRRLDLGQVWGTAITQDGLQTVSLNDLYRVWVRFLYSVVEMENALLNDYSIRAEQVTYNERRAAPDPSPYRIQLLLQTHARFLRDYLGGTVGTSLETLWALTSGLCSERVPARWMRQRIAEIYATPTVQAALELGSLAQMQLSSGIASLPELAALTDLLADADQRYLRDLKLKLREGLQLFERYERYTLEKGAKELLAIAKGLPEVVERYFGPVGDVVRSIVSYFP
jgi:sulfite reductase (NADPH) flavoprotein alpha-component